MNSIADVLIFSLDYKSCDRVPFLKKLSRSLLTQLADCIQENYENFANPAVECDGLSLNRIGNADEITKLTAQWDIQNAVRSGEDSISA